MKAKERRIAHARAARAAGRLREVENGTPVQRRVQRRLDNVRSRRAARAQAKEE